MKTQAHLVAPLFPRYLSRHRVPHEHPAFQRLIEQHCGAAETETIELRLEQIGSAAGLMAVQARRPATSSYLHTEAQLLHGLVQIRY